MRYTLIVDNGKPSEEYIASKKALFNRLKQLAEHEQTGDYAYFDVLVFESVNVTNRIFKEYNALK